MTVTVVPSEAANDSGISSREAGRFRRRASSSVTGSIAAVVVTWWVKADSSATAAVMTPTARV
jgi:hypothetical protein